MAGDPGEGEGADGWAADVGMGLPGVLTGLGLPGEGYMALSHAGGFVVWTDMVGVFLGGASCNKPALTVCDLRLSCM
jgi:hypothetical protein